jgi:hypothetical protein
MEGLWKGPAFASRLLKHYLSNGKEGLSKTTKFSSRVIDVPTQSPTLVIVRASYFGYSVRISTYF